MYEIIIIVGLLKTLIDSIFLSLTKENGIKYINTINEKYKDPLYKLFPTSIYSSDKKYNKKENKEIVTYEYITKLEAPRPLPRDLDTRIRINKAKEGKIKLSINAPTMKNLKFI
jgi:hypothetical protein